MRLISTIESRRRLTRKIVPCEYQSNPVTKVGMAEPSIRNPLYRSIPMLSHHGNDIFRVSNQTLARVWHPDGFYKEKDKLSKLSNREGFVLSRHLACMGRDQWPLVLGVGGKKIAVIPATGIR
jgi:hypothetical protein